MSEQTLSNGEVVNKYRPWPIAHLDHWLAVRQMTKHDYLIVLQSRGWSRELAGKRAAAVRNNPEVFVIPGAP